MLTLWLLKSVDEELDWVLWLVYDQLIHHVLKQLIELFFLNVLFTSKLELQLLVFKHHVGNGVCVLKLFNS